LTANNSLTLAGTDATTHTFPTTSATIARTDAAQTFTGDQTLGTGNLVQGTAAKGLNFTANTPAAGMTSQLFKWYEEGTWTPVQVDLTLTGTVTLTGTYTRIGRMVHVEWYCVVNSGTVSVILSGTPRLTGLPFNPARMGAGLMANNAQSEAPNMWKVVEVHVSGWIVFPAFTATSVDFQGVATYII
jgi:hypothetical protein